MKGNFCKGLQAPGRFGMNVAGQLQGVSSTRMTGAML